MHVVLICTSVIVQLHSVLSSPQIQDITDRCLSHEQIQFFLTTGIGDLDGKVVTILSEKQLNCKLGFLVLDDSYIFGAMEFPEWNLEKQICIQELDSEVMVSDFNETMICSSEPPVQRHSVANRSRLWIHFRDLHDIPAIRIIATSMRDPGRTKCFKEREVECGINNKTYCMNDVFSCDGYANCGIPDFYDEDIEKCKGLGLTSYMIFCIIVMHVMTLFLIVSLFFTLSPKRKETFVYRFDQSMPLFDSENGIVTYDIDIKVIFPKEQKVLTATKSILIKK